MKTLSAPPSRPLVLVCLALALFAAGRGNTARGDSAAAGNGFFAVTVEDERGGAGLGAFTVTTGPDHPLGEGAPLLFAGEGDQPEAGGSYLSVRSYTTGTDYVQTLDGPASGNPVVSLDEWGDVAELADDGYRASYDLPGGDQLADSLRIVSDVAVSGSGAGSAVEFAATVTNTGDYPLLIGVRYLFDVDLAGDDGPVLQRPGPVPEEGSEAAYSPALYTVQLRGSGAAPLDVYFYARPDGDSPPPDRLTFAHWPEASQAAFDYDPRGRDVAGEGGLNDSALLYYFGATPESALSLQPGTSATVSVSMRGSAPAGAEFCGNGSDDDGDALADAADPDCGQESPTPSPAPAGVPPFPVELPRTGGRPAVARN